MVIEINEEEKEHLINAINGCCLNDKRNLFNILNQLKEK